MNNSNEFNGLMSDNIQNNEQNGLNTQQANSFNPTSNAPSNPNLGANLFTSSTNEEVVEPSGLEINNVQQVINPNPFASTPTPDLRSNPFASTSEEVIEAANVVPNMDVNSSLETNNNVNVGLANNDAAFGSNINPDLEAPTNLNFSSNRPDLVSNEPVANQVEEIKPTIHEEVKIEQSEKSIHKKNIVYIGILFALIIGFIIALPYIIKLVS